MRATGALPEEPPLLIPRWAPVATARAVWALRRWSPDALAAHRLRWARAVVHAARHAAPYRDAWRDVDVNAALAAASVADMLRQLPVVGRRDVAAVSMTARRPHGMAPPPGTAVHETSGSSGEELHWEYPPGGAWWLGVSRLAAQHDFGVRALTSHAIVGDDEPRRAAGLLGRLASIGTRAVTANASPDARAGQLIAGRPQLVAGPGKTLVAVGRALWDRGWRPGRWPSTVCTFGEVLEPDTRARLRELWGVDPIDVYGATESGPLATQCGRRDLYHLSTATAIVEVLDDDDVAVPGGEPGRVTVTALWNRLMPAVRYRLDDIALVADRTCACGFPGPALASIDGRAWDWLWDGPDHAVPPQRLWLSFHLDERWLGAVRRWRVHQRRDGAVTVEIEADRDALPDGALDAVRSSVAAEFSGCVAVDVARVERLDVPPGRWRSVASDVWATSGQTRPLVSKPGPTFR